MGKEKGPPLTKKELVERRRAKRLLAKQKREEKYRQVKRDYLARELKYCNLNRKKFENIWEKKLLDIKIKDLHVVYQYHVNYSERILDAKDMEISFLLDDLDIAEEQYEFNLKKYILNFDAIVDAFDQSLNYIKDEYDTELENLLDLSEAERSQRIKLNEERVLNLKLVLFGLEKIRYFKSNETKARYLSRIQEEEDMSVAEIELTQAALEQRFESLWRAYKETINQYRLENNDTKKAYDILYTQDSFMRKLITEQTRQLFKAYDKIYQLRFEQSQEKDAIDLQLKNKMEEHQFFQNGFHTLKQRLKQDVNRDDEQSKNVVKYCNESIKILGALRNKGENILKINGICRKFETDEELIMPYPEFSPRDNLTTKPAADHLKLYKEKKMLDNFLQRCSQGDGLRKELHEEFQFYKQENMLLKNKLRNSLEYSVFNDKNEKVQVKQNFFG